MGDLPEGTRSSIHTSREDQVAAHGFGGEVYTRDTTLTGLGRYRGRAAGYEPVSLPVQIGAEMSDDRGYPGFRLLPLTGQNVPGMIT